MASTNDGAEKIVTLNLVLQVLGAVFLGVVFLLISALLMSVPHSYFMANAWTFYYVFIALAVANCAVTVLFIYKMRTAGVIYMGACAIGLLLMHSSNQGIGFPEYSTYSLFTLFAVFYLQVKKKPNSDGTQ
jgi:hypothetical protein